MIQLQRIAVLAAGLSILAGLTSCDSPDNAPYEGPVIDMHLHALPADHQGPPPVAACVGLVANLRHDPATPWPEAFMSILKNPRCPDPIWSPKTDEALRDRTLAELERLNVIGVLSGPRSLVKEWKALSPERIISGLLFDVGENTPSPQEIANRFSDGELQVLGEIITQYQGIAPDDERLADYWRVAAELDIPVGIHIGNGPPGAPYLSGGYRARLHSPFALEEILIKYPKLRVYVSHAAWPMLNEMKALLYAYPQLHVDTAVFQMAFPRTEYYRVLEDLVGSGFGDRIMFGSDQMVWPELIEEGIDAINEAPFLTTRQKKAILHDNAARFLRLKDR